MGEFLEHSGKGIQSGSVAASPFTEGWSLVGIPAGKFVSFVGTVTKYYGYWMYRNYGGYKDGIQGTIIDAAVGNTLKKINKR
ncbi:hypothetical protein ACF3N7_07275 [Cruoricaptor ignavus]|uniref:hypothetical protein n=1 Tax=Cruoricaptor ignavus TaxID=1118202 RepID=UPI00370D1F00